MEGNLMGKFLTALTILLLIVLSGCNQDKPNLNLNEPTIETIEGEETPIFLQMQDSNGNLGTQSFTECTIQHGFTYNTTTITGWGKLHVQW
jgi:hypothetical protein